MKGIFREEFENAIFPVEESWILEGTVGWISRVGRDWRPGECVGCQGRIRGKR